MTKASCLSFEWGHRLNSTGRDADPVRRSPALAGRACGTSKSLHDGARLGPVVRARAHVAEREVSLGIEYEVASHLRDVELLGMPGLALENKADVAPDDARWCDRGYTPPPETEALVRPAVGIGQPEKGMPKVLGEAFQMAGTGKRHHGNAPLERCDLLVELPQLREMLLTVESTEVAQYYQEGRAAEQLLSMENSAIKRQEIEVKIDPHRIMMRPPWFRYVISIAAGTGPRTQALMDQCRCCRVPDSRTSCSAPRGGAPSPSG